MKSQILKIMLFLFSTIFSCFAIELQLNHCYKVEGPANIRDKPSGKIVSSIHNGKFVKVLKKSGSWYQVSTPTDNKYKCLSTEAHIGWTYKKNIKILTNQKKILNQVLEEGLFWPANSDFDWPQESGSTVVNFFGEKYSVPHSIKEGDIVDFSIPLKNKEVQLFCPDGTHKKAAIKSFKISSSASGANYISLRARAEIS